MKVRHLVFHVWLVAVAFFASGPVWAQASQSALERAAAASARLDFGTALAALDEAIAMAPDAPAPRLARAALHQQMNRPALALDDLNAVLDADPANRAAALARGELHLALGAPDRALHDFDTVLAAAPNDVAGRIARARARGQLGLRGLAEADLEVAAAIDPDAAGLAEAHAALATPAPALPPYEPTMRMDPAFVLTEGDPQAPHALVLVHAGNALADEEALVPRAAYAPALATGALAVTHLFTYTGQDSAIWANLALICAGPDGFAATWAALSAPDATSALDRIDTGRGQADFEALLTAAYAEADLAANRVTSCAFSRAKALAYLTNWTATREAHSWQGASLYDQWPVFVLDGSAVTAPVLLEALRHMTPSTPEETTRPNGSEDQNSAALHNSANAAASQKPAERPGSDKPINGLPAAAADTPENASPPARPASPEGGDVDGAARIPPVLKGIWAPSLAACIGYTDALATPATLDAALPKRAPLAGGSLGTVLLTSRRLVLFDPDETTCGVVSVAGPEDDTDPSVARFLCRGAGSSQPTVPVTLTRLPNEGSAPRLLVEYGENSPLTYLQCRPLGKLGREFAPLWRIDPATCRASAPLRGADFTFAVDGEQLTLTITPAVAPDTGAMARLAIFMDGTPAAEVDLPPGAVWSLSLGQIEPASKQLAAGLLLEATLAEPGGTRLWSRRLPLLGSGRAMDALTTCAEN